MVNNILVISKHAAKKDELLPEPVDFVDLAQFVRKALVPIAEGKDVRLSCSVAPDVPLSMADWEKLAPHFGEPGEQCYQVHPSRRVRAPDDWVRKQAKRQNHGHGTIPARTSR